MIDRPGTLLTLITRSVSRRTLHFLSLALLAVDLSAAGQNTTGPPSGAVACRIEDVPPAIAGPGIPSSVMAQSETSIAADMSRVAHVLNGAEFLASPDHRFDLEGQSLRFTPASAGSYTIDRAPLEYDANLGSLEREFQGFPESSFVYRLSGFSFPFVGQSRSEIHIYEAGGIFFSAPPTFFGQINVPTLETLHMPLIAPFLLPRSVGPYLPVIQVWARETPDRLIVTWRSSPNFDSVNREFDVQAQLRSDGTIVFSYLKTSELSWPTVALMPGLPLPGNLPPSPEDLPRPFTLLDLSNPPAVPQQLPFAEMFQVPNLDVERVWAALKARESYTDDDIDGIAIYQDFYTDIIYYAAAYCVFGNAGADGTMNRLQAAQIRMGSAFPRRPSLMHMSNISTSRRGEPNDGLFLHEFGHRWLYYFDFLEDGTVKTLSGHPYPSMDTSAAFPLSTTGSTVSPMGGNSWTDKGDGRFASSNCGSRRTGFSWHELYLMGLASPEEVAPWFHFEPSQYVGSGGPCEILYAGQRRNIEIESVRGASGDRSPTAAASQKEFRVVLVLLTKDASPSEETMERVAELRRAAMKSFPAATGGRGRLTMLPAIPGRTRPVRR